MTLHGLSSNKSPQVSIMMCMWTTFWFKIGSSSFFAFILCVLQVLQRVYESELPLMLDKYVSRWILPYIIGKWTVGGIYLQLVAMCSGSFHMRTSLTTHRNELSEDCFPEIFNCWGKDHLLPAIPNHRAFMFCLPLTTCWGSLVPRPCPKNRWFWEWS